MNNIHLTVLGSGTFLDVLNELGFNNILNPDSTNNFNKKILLVKILFTENIEIKKVKNILLQNEPIILFLNHKDYIKKNDLIYLLKIIKNNKIKIKIC